MVRHWYAGAAALALIASGALAQTTSETTSTTRSTTTSPAPGAYATDKSATTTEHAVDANGVEVNKSQTYKSGDGTVSATTKSSVTDPNTGYRESASHTERTVVPPPAPPQVTTTVRTTTTNSGE